MKRIKFRTEFSNDCDKFVTSAGNVHTELQYEVVDGQPVIKTDEKGQPVYYDRYEDIQLNKDTNNYRKLLESGCDIKMFGASPGVSIDTTQFSESGADVLSAKAKLEAQNIKVEDLQPLLQRIYEKQIQEELEKRKEKVTEKVKDIDNKGDK